MTRDNRISQMNFNVLPSKYQVEKVGSYYHVSKHGSVGVVSHSLLSTALNSEAFNGLTATYPEKVILKGNLTLDALLNIPNYCALKHNGKITLADGANCHMLTNLSTAPHDIIIDGGMWDGNSANNTGALDGIVIDQSGGDCPSMVERDIVIKNVHMYGTRQHCINVKHTGAAWTYPMKPRILDCDCYTHDTNSAGTGYGLNFDSITDFAIKGGHFGANTSRVAMRLYSVTAGVISDFLTDGGIRLSAGSSLEINNIFCDNSYNQNAIEWTGIKNSCLNNVAVRFLGASAYSRHAVNIATGFFESAGNRFSNVIAYPDSTNNWDYVFYEGDANQDNNQYVNINGLACATGALYLKGAVSKGQHQNIIGTVTEA